MKRTRRFEGKPPSAHLETLGNEPINSAANRKALQLAAQVERTLAQVFAGECGDAVLLELQVEAVAPAPDSSHMLVTLSFADKSIPLDVFLEHLKRAGGRLRSEVAAAIHRRKAPELLFRVVRRMADPAG